MARGVVEDEHPVALHGGQAQVQSRSAEQCPQLRLQALEAGTRHDGFLVDEVPLERGEDFLVGDVDGLQDHEAAQHELFRRKHFAEKIDVEVAGLEPPPKRIRERRHRTDGLDLHEAPVEQHLEVPVQLRGGIFSGEDDGGLDAQADPVRPLKNQLVGEQDLHGRQSLGVQIHPALERPVLVHERAAEGGRGVEGAQLEREERRPVLLLPEGRREHRAHHEVNQLLVFRDDREVLDDPGKLRRVPDLLPDDAGERPAAELVVGGRLRPEGDQWGQAQLAAEGKHLRIRCRRRLRIGRSGHQTADGSHDPILP